MAGGATSSDRPVGTSTVVNTVQASTPDFKWVGLRKIEWKDPSGKSRPWEAAFRTTRRSECDGVAVVGLVHYPKSGRPDEVILVSQFRPPVDAEVIETPAGLVDAGEMAEAAALRELLEETGYTGTILSSSPIVPSDPGMTDANMRYVVMSIDGDAPENVNPKAKPDDGEFITVRRLPAESLVQGLDQWAQAGFKVDARLYAFALGYGLGRQAPGAAVAAAAAAAGQAPSDGCRGGGKIAAMGGEGRKTAVRWAACLVLSSCLALLTGRLSRRV